VGPTIFDCQVFTLDVAGILETLTQSPHRFRQGFGCSGIEEPDHRHRRLLRSRRKWPRRRAADQRDEMAARGHSITSSARASNIGGIWMPSALAVLRLITSSYLVGFCTGRLAGFSPFRMRSTYPAARRWGSSASDP